MRPDSGILWGDDQQHDGAVRFLVGRNGRQFNWELTDPDLRQARQEDPRTLLNMLTTIAGGTP